MTETSTRFALPFLQPGQAQKEMFHNEALVRVDAALHPVSESLATNDPPATPVAGETWIVGPLPSGLWFGHAGELACWTTAGWRFVTPVAGLLIWVRDLGRWAYHDGSGWQAGPLPLPGVAVGGHQVVGARQSGVATPAGGATIDAEARTAIAAMLTALRSHGLIDS